ncbi:ABC transporter substrate-binding protein [Mariniblastus fucicola]|uniref:Bacterial extracellular solute-binding protein, family 5 Middle n=1 Tax=Mariniblastus fucicola TaxID=980251 RepID=A0A5B9P6K1_9BACT|nr:ABC transporter substrate-binding protein [Mariniblastus fucicola]QEG20632.1 Bacterial extracellular solute-binding protein, family 5 Middle [Mariniblastus fucicola]
MKLTLENESGLLRRFIVAAVVVCTFGGISPVGGFLSGDDASLQAQVIEKDGDWPSPLMDEEPFDVLYLDDRSDNAIIKIVPVENLDLPFPEEGNLRFEYREDSEFVLQVPYRHIESYVTFNELLLEEAEDFLRDNQYAPALRNLLYAYDHGAANDPDVRRRLQSCLFKDAVANYSDGNYELALSIFEDLYRKDPDFRVPGINASLKKTIQSCYDGMLEKRFERGDAEYIKSALDGIEKQYGEVMEDFVASWRQKFLDKAKQVLRDARKAAAEGDGRQAHYLSRLAERIQPGMKETRDVQVEITKQYPLIIVAVNQPAGDANPNRLDHWGSRRVGRLTQRTMIELTGLSDEGGRYQFLNGRFERTDDLGMEYAFIFDEKPDPLLPYSSPNQVASRLLDHANSYSPNYLPAWAKILGSVSVDGADRVAIQLRRPFVRPSALARFQYANREEDGQPIQDGVYAMTSKRGKEATFEFNERYPRESQKQYPVVIEEYYRASSDAVDALIRGEVDIVDRPALSDIPKLRKAPGIEVRAYAIPTVHFLVPKVRGEYEGSVQLIRALSTGINREGIVNDVFGGEDIDGCEPLSGPFPIGSDEYDQVSYGYDMKVKSLPYQQRLSMVLSHMANTTKTKKFPKGRSAPPTIVLAHPSGSLATAACEKIKQSWEESGIATTLRPLAKEISFPEDDNWDMLYVEAAIEEPLTDATRIMGTYGIAKDVSSPVDQSLQKLGYAESWQDASRTLRRIHRQVSNDLSIIPMYQIKEHFAFRKNVYGLGRDLIHLYQNIRRWRIEGYASEQKEAK